MNVFGRYSEFYDLVYQDKNYAEECDFLEAMFTRFAAHPVKRILDLGCGTGGHALELVQRGYEVTGVDRSADMLAVAARKAEAKRHGQGMPAVFHCQDIRALDLNETFDAVISMFAVMSYMVENEDLLAALRVARRHLASGGLLIFDAWCGLGVLRDPPTNRFKIMPGPTGERVVRFAQPEVDHVAQRVNVHYKVLSLKDGRIEAEVDEVHPLRFLFPQELRLVLERTGFAAKLLCPFLNPDKALSPGDWNVAVIGQAVA